MRLFGNKEFKHVNNVIFFFSVILVGWLLFGPDAESLTFAELLRTGTVFSSTRVSEGFESAFDAFFAKAEAQGHDMTQRRKALRQAIGKFQAVAQRLARLASEAEAASLAAEVALRRLDVAGRDERPAAVADAWRRVRPPVRLAAARADHRPAAVAAAVGGAHLERLHLLHLERGAVDPVGGARARLRERVHEVVVNVHARSVPPVAASTASRSMSARPDS